MLKTLGAHYPMLYVQMQTYKNRAVDLDWVKRTERTESGFLDH